MIRRYTLRYHRGSDGVLLVYDVQRWDSFVNITKRLSIVEDECGPNVPKILGTASST